MTSAIWIKLYVNTFKDSKVRLLLDYPEGHTIVLLWIQLLLMAGETNDQGKIYISEGVSYRIEDIANLTVNTVDLVHGALELFQRFGMITITGGIIHVTNWSKYQSLDRLEKIREKDRLRKAAERQERQSS